MSFEKYAHFSHATGKMLALVKKPDNSVEEIEINSKQVGQDCLDEVCRRMNIVEVDYLGLKIVKKGERNLQWLNLKNPLLQQLQGHPVHWLELRVKYHVEPHLLQQETTRHLFYLDAKKCLENGKLCVPRKKAAVITALVAQAEHGDYNVQHQQYDFCPTNDLTDEFKVMVITEHNRMRGMRRSSAEYKLLQEAYPLEDYGLEFWHTDLTKEDNTNMACRFGVGNVGVVVRWKDNGTPVEKRILYSALVGSGTDGRYCDISFRTDDYDTDSMRFKFGNKEQAEGFYRAIIESLTFFDRDTVSEEVLGQFTRDLKGTLASLFKEKTTVGKKYMFDIRRTAKEVYDYTRRQLFVTESKNPFANIPEDGLNIDLDKPTDDSFKTKEEEILICRICMVACIDTVFQCGHISCQDCARRLNECHMCKGSVDPAIHIYLPTSS
ncbi:E3 ubiquitin-protein ligase MYLIP-like [Antedon mediterranea]|uniref:E3 ubiquitin-protein ligase MYLIP-like n=1 Tax=Antedon mediterranea TaxID=105859 RepID=UPI003AF7C7D5